MTLGAHAGRAVWADAVLTLLALLGLLSVARRPQHPLLPFGLALMQCEAAVVYWLNDKGVELGILVVVTRRHGLTFGDLAAAPSLLVATVLVLDAARLEADRRRRLRRRRALGGAPRGG